MSLEMKYIAYEGAFAPTITLFANYYDHCDMANNLHIKREELLGAGFVKIDHEGELYCYGKSISLGVKSRRESDTVLLYKNLGVTEMAE